MPGEMTYRLAIGPLGLVDFLIAIFTNILLTLNFL